MKTLSELIAARGIDEAHAVALLNRRARYAQSRDRTKFYASTPLGSIPAVGFYPDGGHRTCGTTNADLITLKLASDTVCPYPNRTHDYVAAWCRLNHLKA